MGRKESNQTKQKLHISCRLLVKSAIQPDILHLYLRAVDVYTNVKSPTLYAIIPCAIQPDILHLYLRAVDVYTNVKSPTLYAIIPCLSKLAWLKDRVYTRTGE